MHQYQSISIKSLKPRHQLVNIGTVQSIDEYANGWLISIHHKEPMFFPHKTFTVVIKTQ